jgi:hypothetical protein
MLKEIGIGFAREDLKRAQLMPYFQNSKKRTGWELNPRPQPAWQLSYAAFFSLCSLAE